MSIEKSLVDAAVVPDIPGNGFKTVKAAVGATVAWPKEKVIFTDQADKVHICLDNMYMFYQPASIL